ncbi:predicted protein [Nematostella vectensis]|uniref:Uncharacterized protein n=1 Tax=Nematostella vectensis TaxID=45351 RepID=A7SF68_NEMVE|nr:predicted protein [Nematostella vectensis]|eukprot:XP_001629696.1 predicted protein [Nematostella vectensis]
MAVSEVTFYKTSKIGYGRELDLFSLPNTDVTAANGKYLKYPPKTQEVDKYTFIIPASSNYIDLKKTFLSMMVKITKADDSNIDNNQSVGLVNYPVGSLFKQVNVWVNGVLVKAQGDLYPYKAYFQALLNLSKSAHETYLAGSMWHKDTAEHMNNQGLKKRGALTNAARATKGVGIVGNVHSDLFSSDRYLIPDVELKLEFFLSGPKFALMSTAQDEKIKIHDLALNFYHVNPAVSTGLEIERALNAGYTAEYPIVSTTIQPLVIPIESNTFQKFDFF